MIEDPPLLTIRRNFPRPDTALVAKLQGAQTGHLVDCMGGRGALDYRIKPLDPQRASFVAVAVTCHAGPDENLSVFAALDVVQDGDVIVAAAEGFTTSCVTGDLLLGMAKNCGVAAFVTDGLARDSAGCRAVGIPLFCAGITPNSPVKNGPGTVGLPIVLGNVQVQSGDVLVGDPDGVVVVPQAQLTAVIARLAEIRTAETVMEKRVRDGLPKPDWLRPLLDSDKVRFLD